MATKITDFFYDISPTETISFRVTGQINPRVSFDGKAQPLLGGKVSITPSMTEGVNAVHELTMLFVFPPGVSGSQTIDVEDATGAINSFPVTGPNNGTFTEIDISLEVV